MSGTIRIDPERAGSAIADLRAAHHLSQADLAELIGTQQARVSEYERGRFAPGLPTLLKLAEALDYDLAWVPRQPGAPRLVATALDVHCRLSPDGDDVSVQCRTCERGGKPVVRYNPFGDVGPYDEARVPTARTIRELVEHALAHVRDIHPEAGA